MPLRCHRRNLLLQAGHQLKASTHRNAGNVVDRLVGVDLRALPACIGQGIDDMGLNALQAELKDLKQADGASANDERVSFNDGAA